MAQKKKKNQRQGHPGRQATQHGTSALEASVQRSLDQITPHYLRWYEKTYSDDGLAMPYLMILGQIFVVTAEEYGAQSLTNFDPQAFAEIFDAIVFSQAEDETSADDESLNMVKDAVNSYVNFLNESDVWTGREEDLYLLGELVDQVLDGQEIDLEMPAQLSSLETQVVGDLNQMKVVQLGRELLRWIGPGRAIEAGGELAAAEAKEAISLFENSLEAQVSSGEDLLMRLYLALALAEAMEIVEDQVRPSAAAQDFLSEDPSVAFGSLFAFVHAFLEETLAESETDSVTDQQVSYLVRQTLEMAADQTPVPVDLPREEKIPEDYWQQMHAQLTELAQLGLVTKGTHYEVPLAVGALLSQFDSGLEGDELEEAEPDFQVPTSGPMLQLKLNLKGAKPPIWRRVQVPAELSLRALHQVIQGAFEWADYHLHEFQLSDVQAQGLPTVPDPFDEYSTSLDEEAITIGRLLRAEKDKISYMYDFGDGWALSIAVEKLLENPEDRTPRCTGGRRMAPVEDSGGLGGWEHIHEAMADPNHEDHQQYREWLLLEDGEEFDPAYFDIEHVNELIQGYLSR